MRRHGKAFIAGCLLLVGLIDGVYLYFGTINPRQFLGAWPINKPLTQSTGFIRRAFVDSDGSIHRYVTFIPYELQPGDHPPAILYLNGHGKNGDDGLASLIDGIAPALWERKQHFPFIVIWPQCPKDGSWVRDGRSAQRALAILDKTEAEYHIDSDRIYLTGLSSGADGVWAVAARVPERFAAIIPISSAFQNVHQLKQLITANLPIWMFSVIEDKGVAGPSLTIHQGLLRAGLSPRRTEVSTNGGDRIDPHDAWDYAFRNSALFTWLLSQRRQQPSETREPFELIDDTRYPVELSSSQGDLAWPPHWTQCQFPIDSVAEIHLEFRASPSARRFLISAGSNETEHSQSHQTLEISLRDDDAGGLFALDTRDCLAASTASGDKAYLSSKWNDVRITLASGKISAELNGWPLLPATKTDWPGQNRSLQFHLLGDPDSRIELRHVRCRPNSSRDQSTHAVITGERNLNCLEQPKTSSNPPLLTDVESAWKERESQFPHVEIEWKQSLADVYSASAFRSALVRTPHVSANEVNRLQLTPTTVQYQAPWCYPRLDLKRKSGLNGRSSLQDYLQTLHLGFASQQEPLNALRQLQINITAQGRVDQVYDSHGRGLRGIQFDRPFPWTSRDADTEDQFWQTPLLATRPFTQFATKDHLQDIVVQPEFCWINGTRCALLEETKIEDQKKYVRRIWIDPLRNHLILRAAIWIDDIFRSQTDLQYLQTAAGEWTPDSWEIISRAAPATSTSDRYYPGNELLQEILAGKVTKFVTNPTTPAGLEIRPGTIAFNQKNNQWFEQQTATERRKLSPTEITDLLAGHSAESPWTRWSTVALIGVALLFGLIMVRWLSTNRRRLRERQMSNSDNPTSPPAH